jgi:hypothetical protein
MPRLDYGPPPCFFLEAGAPAKFDGVLLRDEAGLLCGGKKFSSPVPPGCLDFGGMVEGQILKAVDSALGGGGGGLVLIMGMSPPPPSSPLPPSSVVASGSVESQAKPCCTNF